MIAANHHNPVVCLAESCRVSLENILVVSWLFKAESAIAGNDEQCVRQLILYAQLVYQRIELPVNVSADDDILGFGECICMESIHQWFRLFQ